jgi:ribonucleoside-diphosphate reductase alpha chain
MTLMPAETSAQIANATNGIEAPRELVSIKQSKDGVLAQVVPEIRRLKNKYNLKWDQKSPVGYLKIVAVLQKHIDQAISVNTAYNPKFYENEEIPVSEILQHMIMHYRYGGKTLYYFETYDGAGELNIESKGEYTTPVDDLPPEENCDSCKI